MIAKTFRHCLCIFLFVIVLPVQAFQAFVIGDIRVQGLQRISLGTTLNYLPLRVGETLTDEKASAAIRALYKTGFFEDVKLRRQGQVLVIDVVERPSIAKVEFFGNEDLETEDLKKALKQVGLVEGRVFNRSILDQVQQELQRQYFSLGKYAVKIESTITPLERNRVSVALDIDEGRAAQIRQIEIIGNHAFNDARLLREFSLSTPTVLSFIDSSGRFNRQEFMGDLEKLRSFYLDRGYLHFTVESTQVAITPDKHDIYLTINVSEGQLYHVGKVKLAGEMVVPEADLQARLKVAEGEIFSRRRIVESSSGISERLAVDGYAFANVNAVPQVDEKTRIIDLTFFVDPGHRVYVRRINIMGNVKTRDEVVRREIRQMEGGWLSTPLVDRSKIRLQRLGFFDSVNVETPPVPGTNDQVDLNLDVTEGSTGSFSAGLGYGQTQGLLFNLSVTFNNFLGTGNRVSAEMDNSQVNTIYRFSHTNPYFTDDGVSRTFDMHYRSTDANAANLAAYTTDSYGGGINFGVPLSEYNRATFGLDFDNTRISTVSGVSPATYIDWLAQNGDSFNTLQLSTSWSYDTRNRAIFADRGVYNLLAANVAVPGMDLEYYKVSYRLKFYQPLFWGWVGYLGGTLAAGDGYGGTSSLPFWENYFAGGVSSVRGFRANTLGPRASDLDRAIGGGAKALMSAEIYFPLPFEGASNSTRLSTFVDAGNVFPRFADIRASELRVSAGVSVVWLSPVGALSFSWGWPVKSEPSDEKELFQFTIGTGF